MTRSFLTVLPLMLCLSSPVAADPTLGLGVTFTFGAGSKVETGVGLRAFSDDDRKDFVGSIGVDYIFGSQRIRPSVGVAYLMKKSYVGLDLGYNYGAGGFDVGMGLGFANTRTPAAAPAPTPPTTPVLTAATFAEE